MSSKDVSMSNPDKLRLVQHIPGRSAGNGSICKFEYPDPPIPQQRLCIGVQSWMPDVGIYFVWGDDLTCLYVGQSKRMKKRCHIQATLKTGQTVHSRGDMALFAGELCSVLEFREEDLLFAESYYIGLLRPLRNHNSNLRGCWGNNSPTIKNRPNFDWEKRRKTLEVAKWYRDNNITFTS